MTMRNVAIIPAGGSGKRMQDTISKQYLLLDRIPVLVHTLKIFQESHKIDEIFLVVPADDVEFARRNIVEKYGILKVTRILEGGKERQDSVRNGINSVRDDHGIVVVHDAVRPLITEDLIDIVINEAVQYGAVTVAAPARDTVKSVDDDGWVIETLERNRLWLIQTPQAFKRDIIKKAYDAAYQNNFYGTDDASLVERIGMRVKIITGSYSNIKLTTKDDILLAEFLIKKRKADAGKAKN